MSYKNAMELLPSELLNEVQKYIDGECIYIPRNESNKKSWGTNTSTRQELKERNKNIYNDYLAGTDMNILSARYYLSVKSIQRIVLKEKKNNS